MAITSLNFLKISQVPTVRTASTLTALRPHHSRELPSCLCRTAHARSSAEDDLEGVGGTMGQLPLSFYLRLHIRLEVLCVCKDSRLSGSKRDLDFVGL